MAITTPDQWQEYLIAKQRMVEKALDRYLPPASAQPEHLHQSIRYSVLAPGKRLRPVLAIAAAEAIGRDAETVLPSACAMECVHAFSLIHDDLPIMDNDDYRRGRLTNHKVYGEAIALLAGDALLALAFELIVENAGNLPPNRVVQVMQLVAHASGSGGMVGGQVVDIESEGREIDPGTLQFIHHHKTGALITASVLSGAILAGASHEQLEALKSYGESIGLAFQIMDDLLDILGDAKKLGKPIGSDQKQKKATYPRLYGLEESRRRSQNEIDKAVKAISDFDHRADPLRTLAHYIIERDQ